MNAYPELPIIPYVKTSVAMNDVIEYLQARSCGKEIKRMCYIMFRVESGNGISGVNENYIGAQTDSGRWPADLDPYIIGVVQKVENRTGKTRLFAAFADFKANILFLINRVETRGMYIGGENNRVIKMQVNNVTDLANAYYKSWVTGMKDYKPTQAEMSSFTSMYKQSEKLFV